MAVSEHPMHALAEFLPPDSFELVTDYIHRYSVHLTITKKRVSVLGDYRHAGIGRNHRISINGNLNKYEFLITLLHELAHLLTFEQYTHTVEPHGRQWKSIYSSLLQDFVQHKVFPPDVEKELQRSMTNPAATANGETDLLLVLRKYNQKKKDGMHALEELEEGAVFETDNGRQFRKGKKRRKRYECLEIKTGNKYSFSPVSEVRKQAG